MLYPLIIILFFGVFCYFLNLVIRKITYSPRIQLLGKVVSQIKTREKVVALTYDDGPNPLYTHQLLDVLERLQVKATFFVVGKQVEQYPETVKLIIRRGHELGNHSYSHAKMVWKTPKFVLSEIQKTDRLLRELGVEGEISFRPPFGFKFLILPYILDRLGKTSILWNLDAEDYKEIDISTIVSNVLNRVTPGSIILLHDRLDSPKDVVNDRSRTISATEILIEKMLADGYQFKLVSELLDLQRVSSR